MAVVNRYVNTGSSAGGDGTTNATSGANRAYVDIAEWESAEDGLSAGTDDHILHITGFVSETTRLLVNGWAADVKITWKPHVDAIAYNGRNGDICAGRTSTEGSTQLIYHNFKANGLKLVGTGSYYGQINGNDQDGEDWYFNNCWIKAQYSANASGVQTLKWRNCYVVGGIDIGATTAGNERNLYLINCVVLNRIIHRDNSILYFQNSIALASDFHLGQGTYTGAVTNVQNSIIAENVTNITNLGNNHLNETVTGYFTNQYNDLFLKGTETNALNGGVTTIIDTPAFDANGVARVGNICDIGMLEYRGLYPFFYGQSPIAMIRHRLDSMIGR